MPAAARGSKPPGQVFYGWTVVAASFLLDALAYGTKYSFGVFFKPIQQEFGWSRAAVSGAASIFWIGHGAFAILMGWAGDRFGPRKVLSLAILISGSALLLVGGIQNLWQLYLVYGVIFSFGVSAVWTVLTATVSRWFTGRRGLALGLIAAGTGTGTVFLPLLSLYLISAYGWRMAYGILGLGLLVLGLAAAQLLRRDPGEMGLKPYGWKPEASTAAAPAGESGIALLPALRRRSLWLLALMHLCTSVALQMVMTHLVNYATDVGIAAMLAASFVSFVAAASVAGRLAIGTASDRIGRRRAFAICTLANGLAILWLIGASSTWMFIAFAAFFGFFYGGWIPLFPALTGEIFGTSHLGAIYGVISLASGIGGVIGPALAGYLFDLSSSYSVAFFLGAMAMFFAALGTGLLERPTPAR